MLGRLIGAKHLAAELHEIDHREIVGDVPEAPPDILLSDVELLGDILRVLADIEVPVDHHDADQGRRQEVRHIVVDPDELIDLALILGIDRVELLVDRLQLLVGALEFLVGGQQLFICRLQLGVDRLELGDRAAQVVSGLLEFLLKIGNLACGSRIDLVADRIRIFLLSSADKGGGDKTGILPDLVHDRLGDHLDKFRLFVKYNRNIIVNDPVIAASRLPKGG